MDLGFETLGNATVLCHDRVPVLVTDPWLTGEPYFGSWTFSHDVPAEQLDAIGRARFVWFSHGHPDHLSFDSLRLLHPETVLLPDHVGGRIAGFLRGEGYQVQVLRDREWTQLSDRIRVMCLADYNQDGILLVDIGGRLVVNFNDASDRNWGRFVASVARRFETSVLLRLSGFGDADMINFHTEDGAFVPPPAAKRAPIGPRIAQMSEALGATHFVPFSSMHKYQRSDSVWANPYTTELEDYAVGFESKRTELLPAFVRWDCTNDEVTLLAPPERPRRIAEPGEYGDDWSDELEPADVAALDAYIRSVRHLERHFDFVNFRVGGRDNRIELNRRTLESGITFEVPRGSLMTAVRYEIFDDLLIGNFMRTILHGDARLYPHFTPYVAKYADNGRARTRAELRRYHLAYLRRSPLDYLRDRLERRSRDTVRSIVQDDSAVYRVTRKGYHRVKGW